MIRHKDGRIHPKRVSILTIRKTGSWEYLIGGKQFTAILINIRGQNEIITLNWCLFQYHELYVCMELV